MADVHRIRDERHAGACAVPAVPSRPAGAGPAVASRRAGTPGAR